MTTRSGSIPTLHPDPEAEPISITRMHAARTPTSLRSALTSTSFESEGDYRQTPVANPRPARLRATLRLRHRLVRLTHRENGRRSLQLGREGRPRPTLPRTGRVPL